MKQSLLLCLFLFAYSAVCSQFERGSVSVSAGVSLYEGIQVYPALGLFVKENVLLGVRVSSNGNRDRGAQATRIGMSLPIRRYLTLPVSSLWAWWEIQPGVTYASRWVTNANLNRNFQWRGSASFQAGVSYQFRPRWFAEAGIGLLSASAGQDVVSDGGQTNTEWVYSWGVNVFSQPAQLAVTYVFGKKKP